MPNELQVLLVGIVLVAVAGFAGYKIYKNWNADPSTGFTQTVMFILKNIDNFVEDLKEALETMDDVMSGYKFENDAIYREDLIEAAITIIEKEAAEAGVTFKLSHDTLVNLAEIAITQAIKLMKIEDTRERTVNAKVNMVLKEYAEQNEQVDITAYLTSDN